MGLLAAFIVGALLGWIVTWAIQKRLDDNLIDEVAKLQRQIADYQRQADALQPAAATVGEKRMPAGEEAGAAAAVVEEIGSQEVVSEDAAQADQEVQPTYAEASETTEAAEPAVPEADVVEQDADAQVLVAEPVQADERLDVNEPAQEEVNAEVADEGSEAEQSEPDVAEAPPAAERTEEADDFTMMRGVGPKYAESLNAAGITTFDELANTSPEKLQEILQPAAWHKVDFEDWIAQAKELASQQ